MHTKHTFHKTHILDVFVLKRAHFECVWARLINCQVSQMGLLDYVKVEADGRHDVLVVALSTKREKTHARVGGYTLV